jgi:hypothetical protein
LKYENNETEDLQIGFSDWFISTPVYDEKVAWSGNVVQKDKQSAHLLNVKYNIFAIKRRLSKSEILKSIVLPNCPTIHIFAMTLL